MARLRTIARNLKDNLLELGKVLIEAEKRGEPLRVYLDLLKNEFQIDRAEARVALRWARGDFGNEDQGRLLVTKVAPSLLATWDESAIQGALGNSHRVIDPEKGCVVELALDQMSRSVVSRNVGPQGFVPISARVTNEVPEVRSCYARSVFRDETGRLVLEASGKEPVRMLINKDTEERLSEILAEDAVQSVGAKRVKKQQV